MKFLTLTFGALLAPWALFAQSSSPDTLKIDVKKGQQIILIGNDLRDFERIKVDSIIRKSLSAVKDSLVVEDKKPLSDDALKKQMELDKKSFLEIGIQLGAGLIQDNPSPSLNFILKKALKSSSIEKASKGYNYLGLGYSNCYLFREDASGKNNVYANGFIELSFGQYKYRRSNEGEISKAFLGDFGIGYLIRERGGFFQRNTFKIFSSATAFKHSIIRGELNIDNNFKKIYPGFTFYF